MKLLPRLPFSAPTWLLAFSQVVEAQTQEGPREVEVPNPMGAHTWFIIAAIAAFLAWSISYSLELHREVLERKKGRDELLRQKEQLLDNLADLENRKDAGQVSEQRYKHEVREMRFRLSKVLEKIGQPGPARSQRKSS
jgi:hypothetical protein